MKKNKYFYNTSLPLSTFLFSKNQQIVGINPTGDGNKKEFAFLKTDYLEELVDLYTFPADKNDPELLVNAHTYEIARKELLNKLLN